MPKRRDAGTYYTVDKERFDALLRTMPAKQGILLYLELKRNYTQNGAAFGELLEVLGKSAGMIENTIYKLLKSGEIERRDGRFYPPSFHTSVEESVENTPVSTKVSTDASTEVSTKVWKTEPKYTVLEPPSAPLKEVEGIRSKNIEIDHLNPPKKNWELFVARLDQLNASRSDASSYQAATAALLRDCGFDVDLEVFVPDRGDGMSGRVDIVATSSGGRYALELDNQSARQKSIFKLQQLQNCERFILLRATNSLISVRPQEKKEEPKPFDPAGVELPNFLEPQVWLDWCAHRREVKNPLTPTTTKQQLALLSRTPDEANAVITQSIERGWTGLFPLKNERRDQRFSRRGVKNGTSDPVDEKRRRDAEEWERLGVRADDENAPRDG